MKATFSVELNDAGMDVTFEFDLANVYESIILI